MTRIDCATARELMLEAEIEELRSSDSTLGRHIASCADCETRVRAILRGYEDLDAGLATLAPSRTNVIPMRRRWQRWAPLPLAAAAAIALLLMPQQEKPVKEPTLLARLMLVEDPVVTPPEGKQVIVMEKNDLTVVWLY